MALDNELSHKTEIRVTDEQEGEKGGGVHLAKAELYRNNVKTDNSKSIKPKIKVRN